MDDTSVKDWLAVVAMVALLVAGGVLGVLGRGVSRLRDWLVGHELLLSAGGGVVTIPHVGALDLGRVVIVVALLVLILATARILAGCAGRADR